MKLTTRSRYGIRLMYDLAIHYGQGYIFLKDISERQQISEKYLGQLILPLKSAELVTSSRGAHGGYSLSKRPEDITLFDIVNSLEGTLCVVECVRKPEVCDRVSSCPTRPVWEKFDNTINDFLKGISLESLKQNEGGESLMYNI
ncbi:MAG TPA: Rrf2 family transcriptional regulator [Spirochaetota bacterium]|nr:Rrf2 family transcriptional regulator [Spirochaetota bacterium]